MGKEKSGKKLCVICSCFGDNVDDFKIFILDLVHGGEGKVPLVKETVPNFRIQSKREASFCIFNSVIYMFDYKIICDDEDEEKERQSGYDRNCVYKYRLDPDEDSKTQNIYLEKSMMDKVESMLTPKQGAQAIPTPDGRILCHSTEIPIVMIEDDDSYVFNDKLVHFEIYDPETESWAQLPPLELRVSSGYHDLQIKDLRTRVWNSLPIKPLPLWNVFSFTVCHSFFISKHALVLLIRLYLGGIDLDQFKYFFVSLDIVSPTDQGWQPYRSGWLNSHAHLFNPFLVVEDRLSLSCYDGYAKDKDDKSGVEIEHQLSKMPVLGIPDETNIAVVDYRPNKECSFYGVRSRGTDTRVSYLVIDFFKYTLPTRNKKKLKKKKMLGAAAVPQFHHINSFQFRISEPDMFFRVRTASVLPRTIFPFPT